MQVQRSGDHRSAVNKFASTLPAASHSQMPLTVSTNPLPTSSTTQSITSLSRFAPTTAVAVCTISGGSVGQQQTTTAVATVQTNGDVDSNNLS